MKKLDEEEIYHLMDLLVMNTNNTKEQILLDDLQKKESISYDTDLIAKLESFLNELWFRIKAKDARNRK